MPIEKVHKKTVRKVFTSTVFGPYAIKTWLIWPFQCKRAWGSRIWQLNKPNVTRKSKFWRWRLRWSPKKGIWKVFTNTVFDTYGLKTCQIGLFQCNRAWGSRIWHFYKSIITRKSKILSWRLRSCHKCGIWKLFTDTVVDPYGLKTWQIGLFQSN